MSKKSKNALIKEAQARLQEINILVDRGAIDEAKELLIIHEDLFEDISNGIPSPERRDFQAYSKSLSANFRELDLALTNGDYIINMLIGRDKQDTKENRESLAEQKKLATATAAVVRDKIGKMNTIIRKVLANTLMQGNQ